MNWTVDSPRPAQIVRTKVSFYYHYGIYVSDDEVIQFGLPDDPMCPGLDIRVLTTDVDTFLGGGDLEVARPTAEERRTMRSPQEIIKTARSRIGEGGYDILHNNCEHFVNDCTFGAHRSSFVDGVRERIRAKLGKKD